MFLSAYVESDLVYKAIAMGAGAYLSKEADRAAIFDAVAAVARGEAFLSPEIQTGLTAQIRMREASARPVLTPRERQILRLTADGRSAHPPGRHGRRGRSPPGGDPVAHSPREQAVDLLLAEPGRAQPVHRRGQPAAGIGQVVRGPLDLVECCRRREDRLLYVRAGLGTGSAFTTSARLFELSQ